MNLPSVIITLLALFLLLIFIYYKWIIRSIRYVVNIMFFIGFVGLLSIAFYATGYENLSDDYFKKHYVGTQLLSADSSLTSIDESFQKVDGFFKRFGAGPYFDNMVTPGIYPTVSTLLADILIAISFVFFLAAMVLSIYFKYTLTGYSDSLKLLKKVKKIEEEVTKLKNHLP